MIKFKKTRRVLLFFLVISIFSAYLLTEGVEIKIETEKNWRNNISCELLREMENAGDNEKIPVYVWTTDINHEQVEEEVKDRTGLTRETLQEEYQLISNKIGEMENANKIDDMLVRNSVETKTQRLKEQERTDKYIVNKREIAKNEYKAKNASTIKKFGFDQKDVMFSSKYSPMSVVKLTKSQIENVCKSLSVEQVYLYKEMEFENLSSDSIILSVEADYTQNTMGYDGSGIKIGMIEPYLPSRDYYITKGKVDYVGSGIQAPTGDQHALDVACIILKTAPGAHIYATGASTGSIVKTIENIEALLDHNVSVINMSAGSYRENGTSNWYWAFEEWVDHIGAVHGASFVCAAGNNAGNVYAPGLAYNVITVGGILDNDTGSYFGDDTFYYASSYANGGTAGCAKPDVMAPCNAYGETGTSYAAPVVTGVIAQMQECRPALKSNTRIVKAVLTAGCDRKVPGESMGGLTAVQGAGVINARKSMTVLTAGRYAAFHFEPNIKEINKNINITSADQVIRIAYAWTRTNYTSGSHTAIGTVVAPYINVDMYVYRPSGAEQGRSTIPTSSAELLHFYPDVYGTYRVKLTRSTNLSYKVWGALAWY